MNIKEPSSFEKPEEPVKKPEFFAAEEPWVPGLWTKALDMEKRMFPDSPHSDIFTKTIYDKLIKKPGS
ncbi:MAG TPA: hypothetical protein VMV71_02655 [Candidatus Paceibacterota bacterium]|nr:hypothetical protein [Candidatus Paceibacterota bacterium]